MNVRAIEMCTDSQLCIICGAVNFISCLNTYAHGPYSGTSNHYLKEMIYSGERPTAAEWKEKAKEKRKEIDWVNTYLFLGENPAYEPKGDGDHRIFFTNESKCNEVGWFPDFEPGDDARLPEIPIIEDFSEFLDASDGMNPSMWKDVEDPHTYVNYNDDDAYPLLLAFHSTCYKDLLCNAIAARMNSRSILPSHGVFGDNSNLKETVHIDRKALYETLKIQQQGDLYGMGPPHKNKEEFGLPVEERRICQCDLWPICFGPLGSFITNPGDIPQLQQYYLNLPTRSKLDEIDSGEETKDVFSSFPMEINLLVLQNLPPESVGSLSTVSPVIAATVHNTSYWRDQFRKDQPWLFDLPDEAFNREDVHWYQVYKELMERSEDDRQDTILGLANRRRIWRTCEMITDVYFGYVDGKIKY